MLCVDEKPQIQALQRTAPILPVRPGNPEAASFDYVRDGTTTLFAALEVATRRITDACTERHRHQEFLAFLERPPRHRWRPIHLPSPSRPSDASWRPASGPA